MSGTITGKTYSKTPFLNFFGRPYLWVIFIFSLFFSSWGVVGQTNPKYSWEKSVDMGIAGISSLDKLVISVDVDSKGNIYALTFGKKILKYDANGGSPSSYTLKANIEGPVDMAINSQDEMYVADYEGRTIFAFDLDGNNKVTKNKSSGYFKPLGVAFDKVDNLYVADYNDGTGAESTKSSRLKIHFANGGQSPDLLTTNLIQPYRLDIDSKGNIYVSHAGSDQKGEVKVFDKNFQELPIMAGIKSPGSIVIDSEDFIHIIYYAERVDFQAFIRRDVTAIFNMLPGIRTGIRDNLFKIGIYSPKGLFIENVQENNEREIDFPLDLSFGFCASKMYLNDAYTSTSPIDFSLKFNLEIFSRTPLFDMENPIALCIAPGKEFTLDNGSVTITPADINAGSSDNCSFTLSVSPSTFTTSGPKPVTLTATDDSGNTNSCSTTIEIKNQTAPPINCKPASIYLDSNGVAVLNPAAIFDGNATSSNIDRIEVDKSSFNCSDIGTKPVVLTVFYTNGTTAACTAQVTIADNIDPIALCIAPGKEFTLNNGSVTITPADINAGSSDNCSFTLSVLPSTFTTPGPKSVTLTAKDGFGNTHSCSTTIEIKNQTAPPINCKPASIYLDSNGVAVLNPAAIFDGNATSSNIDRIEVDKSSFNCSDIGTKPVVLTVFYTNGTTAACTAQVTIADNIDPIALCVAPGKEFTLDNGSVTITPADINAGSSDNCSFTLGVLPSTFTTPGPKSVTLTATDGFGNTHSCSTTIEIKNQTAPPINCKPASIYLDSNGVAVLNPAAIFDGIVASSNIDRIEVDKPSFTCSDVGGSVSVLLTVQYTDGTSDSCTAQVTVLDEINPVVQTRNINVIFDSFGTVTITPEMIDNGSTDNCGSPQLSLDVSTFSCNNLGENIVILTATDTSENSASLSAIVTVTGSCIEIPETDFPYISIYPNPTPGPFTFDTPNGWSIEKVEVFDARGRYVLTDTYSENEFEYSMDLSGLQESVYFLKLYTSQGIKILRVIIN
jgi:sugar lactone lactonase YvrE